MLELSRRHPSCIQLEASAAKETETGSKTGTGTGTVAVPSSQRFKQFRVLVLVVALSGIRHFIMPLREPENVQGADLGPQTPEQSAEGERGKDLRARCPF